MFGVKIIQIAVGLVGVFWLAIVGAWGQSWWDNRPAHTPRIHIPLLFGCCTWEAPESLKARLQSYIDADALALARAQAINREQAVESQIASTAETKAQAVIVTRYRTLLKEVPTYVTQNADTKCVVPVGFVRLLDAAAAGNDLPAASPSPGESYDAPAHVELDTVASSVVSNYGAANANAQQLKALEDWVRAEGMNP